MNREIKFRAFSKDKGLIYFGLFDLDENFILTGGGFDIKKNTPVMQYTGLKDKNGKEIYEGDILQATTDFVDSETLVEGSNKVYKAVVKFGNWGCRSCHGVYGFYVDAIGSNKKLGWDVLNLENHEEIEVIGNIYETPKLLR